MLVLPVHSVQVDPANQYPLKQAKQSVVVEQALHPEIQAVHT